MQEEEKRLKQEIATMLAEAHAADATEDACHGPDRHGDELPEELARRRVAWRRSGRPRPCWRSEPGPPRGGGPGPGAAGGPPRREAEGKAPPKVAPADAVPEAKDQINFTDPGSRIMKVSNKGWGQCGNAQAVANEPQILLAADVTDQANDTLQAVPMVDQARANLDAAGVERA